MTLLVVVPCEFVAVTRAKNSRRCGRSCKSNSTYLATVPETLPICAVYGKLSGDSPQRSANDVGKPFGNTVPRKLVAVSVLPWRASAASGADGAWPNT